MTVMKVSLVILPIAMRKSRAILDSKLLWSTQPEILSSMRMIRVEKISSQASELSEMQVVLQWMERSLEKM